MTTSDAASPTQLVVPSDAEGMRLDVFLLPRIPGAPTRGDIQRAIRDGDVHIRGKRVIKPSTIVRTGQEIVLREAVGKRQSAVGQAGRLPTAHSLLPKLVILHEDPAFLVIEKPAGVPVHAGIKREPSLADALRARYPSLSDVGESPERPGIVHRLDKDTSGVLLIARTPDAYAFLKRQFQAHTVRKEYVALVDGVVTESDGSVKLPIARSRRNPLRRTIARAGEGKDAETAFRVLERFREHTLLAVFPRTGRMHQIRVHLAHLGFPVAGDPLYGRRSRGRMLPGLSRQFLHATALTITLPSGRQKTFQSPLPDDLARVLEHLRGTSPHSEKKPLTYRWRTPRAPR